VSPSAISWQASMALASVIFRRKNAEIKVLVERADILADFPVSRAVDPARVVSGPDIIHFLQKKVWRF
jgi:hypothetical protein